MNKRPTIAEELAQELGEANMRQDYEVSGAENAENRRVQLEVDRVIEEEYKKCVSQCTSVVKEIKKGRRSISGDELRESFRFTQYEPSVCERLALQLRDKLKKDGGFNVELLEANRQYGNDGYLEVSDTVGITIVIKAKT